MKHGLTTCDVCGAVGAIEVRFRTDRELDAAGNMDDVIETLDLCADHQRVAYEIAEDKYGFELAGIVLAGVRALVHGMTDKRDAALRKLPK